MLAAGFYRDAIRRRGTGSGNGQLPIGSLRGRVALHGAPAQTDEMCEHVRPVYSARPPENKLEQVRDGSFARSRPWSA